MIAKELPYKHISILILHNSKSPLLVAAPAALVDVARGILILPVPLLQPSLKLAFVRISVFKNISPESVHIVLLPVPIVNIARLEQIQPLAFTGIPFELPQIDGTVRVLFLRIYDLQIDPPQQSDQFLLIGCDWIVLLKPHVL